MAEQMTNQQPEEENKKKKKGFLFILLGVLVAAGIAVGAVLLTGNGGSDSRSAEEKALANQLSAEGSATVEISSDITTTQPLVIVGDKTLTGSGTIKASAGEYAITLADGATLTLDGPTIDCQDGATNGIYVSPQAVYNQLSGSIINLRGHGVRNLGQATFSGGLIDNAATNWLMVDEGATVEITGGTMSNAGEVGVITGAGSTLNISGSASFDTAAANLVYTSGTTTVTGGSFAGTTDYQFFNAGNLTIKDMDLDGATLLGYLQNETGATASISNVNFKSAGADYFYNFGVLDIANVTLAECGNTAIENQGTLTINGLTCPKMGASFLINKSATATVENVTIDEVGAYVVNNRAAQFTGKNITVKKVGASAFMNDFVDHKHSSGAGNFTLDTFEIGSAEVYGIRSNGGTVTLTNGTFGNCKSHGAYFKDGTTTVTDVDFLGSDPDRAVVQIGYKTATEGVNTFTNVNITGGCRGLYNYANLTWTGGSIYGCVAQENMKVGSGLKNSGVMVIDGGEFYNNTSLSSGGAIYNTAKLEIKGGAVIRDNTTVTSGGGIANNKEGTLTITSASVYGNKATNYGGGIYNAGTLNFEGGTVSNNKAGKGGGGIESTGTATLTGGTIKNNTSSKTGGGFYCGSKGTATLAGVTIKNNTSGSESSAGGVYSLGKVYIKSGTVITGNTSGTYGGGVSNGISNDKTKIGVMYISGGTITDNKAGTKGGGGVYNRGTMVISGGTIRNNNIVSTVNGKNVYNSGNLTITGGKMNNLTEKPYDIYSYKGNVNLEGSPKIGSIYRATEATVTISGKIKSENQIKYYMTSYAVGIQAFHGTSKHIAGSKAKFDIEGVLTNVDSSDEKYVNNDGFITKNGVNLNKKEAELWRDGKKIASGLFSAVSGLAKDGDTLKIVGDILIEDYVGISYFSSSKDSDKTKTVTMTDDGKHHTITIATGDVTGFYIASSNGDGNGGKSATGYYPRSVVFNITGTEKGGLTFKGSEDMHSAAFYVATNATLNVNGNVEFKNFTNVAGEDESAHMTEHTTGKRAGAIYVSASGTLNVNGATFTNNTDDQGGGAIYVAGKATIKNAKLTGNHVDSGKNGGAIYVSSTGDLTLNNTRLENNKAENGGAIYIYGGKATLSNVVLKNNKANADTTTTAQALYVTSKPADEDGDAVNGSLTLKNVTATGATGEQNSITARTDTTVYISGKVKVDRMNMAGKFVVNDALSDDSYINVQLHKTIAKNGQTLVKAGSGVGSSTLAAATKKINILNPGADKLTLETTGKLKANVPATAQLWRDGKLIQSSSFQLLTELAEDGDTIKLIGDVTLTEHVGLTFFTRSADSRGQRKTYTITDDGKARTITVNTGSETGFYISASSGDGANGTSESGYYRTYVTVNFVGTENGGLTIQGGGDMKSAGIYAGSNSTINMTGNVTLQNFNNVETEAGSSSSDHTTGKNGGAIYANKSATLNLDGTSFINNCDAAGGGAIYGAGKMYIKHALFSQNHTSNEKNGGAIYVTSTGDLTVRSSSFKNNNAENGGAIYVYGGSAKIVGTGFSKNTANSTGTTTAQSVYVTSKPADEETNDPAVYGSLELNNVTIKGANASQNDVTARDNTTVKIGGKVVVGRFNLATPMALTEALSDDSSIGVVLYKTIAKDGQTLVTVCSGVKASLIKPATQKMTLTNPGYLELTLETNGKLKGHVAANAQLWRDGELIEESVFQALCEIAESGDVIKLIGDVTLTSPAKLSYFTKTEANKGKTKEYTITDDGNPHTITVDTGSNVAIYAAASSGSEDGEGTSDSGYYRTYDIVNIKGVGGITFKAAGDMQSAAVYVSSNTTLNISGKVTFDGFNNTQASEKQIVDHYEEEMHGASASADTGVYTSGIRGGAIFGGSSATININGTTFNNCCDVEGGGAIYATNVVNIKNAKFTNCKATGDGKNGGAIYIPSTGNFTISNTTFTNCTANNGGAIYVYAGTLTADGLTFDSCDATINKNSANSLYVTSKAASTEQHETDPWTDAAPAAYSTVSLKNITVKGSKTDEVDINVRDGNAISLGGAFSVDNFKIEETPITLTKAITGEVKLLTILSTDYKLGQQILTGTGVATSGAKFTTVNNGTYQIGTDGKLEYAPGAMDVASVTVGTTTTNYKTFDEAFEAANAATSATLKLLTDITLAQPGSTYSRVVTGNITLDLNGKTLDTDETHTRSIFTLGIKGTSIDESEWVAGGTLTIKDSSADKTGVIKNLYAANAGAIVSGNNEGKLILNSGTLTGVTTGNGGVVRLQYSSTFTMNGGQIKDSKAALGGAIYNSGSSGSVTINGGEISNIESTVIDAENADIFVKPTLNITGNDTLIGCSVLPGMTTNGITGGYFRDEVTPATGYKAEANEDISGYNYLVIEDPNAVKVAKVGTEEFISIEAAVAAAVEATSEDNTSVTLTLLADVSATGRLNFCTGTSLTDDTVKRTITVDFNGHKLSHSYNNGAFGMSKEGTLILTDTSEDANGGIVMTDSAANYYVYHPSKTTTTKIEAGVYTGVKSTGTLKSSNGTLNITGGTFNLDPTSFTDPTVSEVLVDTPSAGLWTVEPVKAKVAKVDDTEYTTLKDAFAAADGKTVTVIADITETETSTVSGNVTLDLAGYKVTAKITVNGILTIKGQGECDTAFSGSGNIKITGTGKYDQVPAWNPTSIEGGYFKTDVSDKCAAGFKCQASTTYTDYGYEVVPTQHAGVDIEPADEFE